MRVPATPGTKISMVEESGALVVAIPLGST